MRDRARVIAGTVVMVVGVTLLLILVHPFGSADGWTGIDFSSAHLDDSTGIELQSVTDAAGRPVLNARCTGDGRLLLPPGTYALKFHGPYGGADPVRIVVDDGQHVDIGPGELPRTWDLVGSLGMGADHPVCGLPGSTDRKTQQILSSPGH